MRVLMILWVVLGVSVPSLSLADDSIRRYFENLQNGYELPVHGEYLVNTAELQRLYHDRNHQPLWYKNGSAHRTVGQLQQAIQAIGADGLQPEDYHSRPLQQYCVDDTVEGAAECDLLLSDAFLLLAQHLLAGKVNPRTLEPGWQPEERRRNLVSYLRTASAENKVRDVLGTLRPASLEYQRLMSSLRRLRAATDYPEWSALETAPAIQPGEEDPRLQAIVNRLVFWGDMEASTTPTTKLDEALVLAVQRFQERHGLTPSGTIDEATLSAFNVGPTKRAQQIMANLERWRWLDEALGPRHLSVNIAEHRLETVKHDSTAYISPIEISHHFRDVPVFSSLLRYVVLNPAWVVPEEQAVKDILPLLQSDPARMEAAGFKAYREDEPVEQLSQVNWQDVETDPFPYRLVQGAGPGNALGGIKFVAPNPYQVTLHGIPQEGGFEVNGFNAGSVRVEDPMRLAAWVLEGHVFTDGQLEDLIAKQTNDTIYLMEPLPLHVQYRTAWVNAQGVLNFRDDVYERDDPLYQALIQPLPKRSH